MKYNKSLVLFMIFTVIACISIVGSASAADTTNTTINTTNTAITTNATGQSAYKGPQTNTTKYTNGNDQGYATHTKNGTTYTVKNGDLYAINPNGTTEWTYTIDHSGGGEGGFFQNAPTLGPDGTIYMLGMGKLYAINSNGTAKWIYDTRGTSMDYGSPIMSANGVIYFANGWSVWGIDTTLADPTKEDYKYKFDSNGQISGGLTPSADGKTFYFTTTSTNTIYAIDSTDLTLKWSNSTIGKVDSGINPIIGSDGTIYIGSSNSGLCAFNQNGTLKWSYTNGTVHNGNIAIAADGTIYIGLGQTARTGYLYALNSDGNLKWAYYIGKPVTSTPVIGSDGTVYFGATNGIIYALNPDGNVKWQYNIGGSPNVSSLGSDGTLYISNGVIAIQDLIANLTAKPGANPLNCTFTDTSSNIPTKWSWDFGDGNTSTDQNPTHKYANPGTYTVTLTVTNANDVTNTTTQTITVQKDSTAPTATTKPNGTYNNPNITITSSDDFDQNPTLYYSLDNGVTWQTAAKTTTLSFADGTYTVQYYAEDATGNKGTTQTATYTIDTKAPTATANVASGTYNTNKVVTIIMNENGTIYYTLNGATPTTSSTRYTGPITISSTKTLKYIAVDNAGNTSPVYTAAYNIDKTAPKISATTPKNKAVTVTRTGTISIKFSESIKTNVNWSKVYVKNLKTGKKISISKWIKGNMLYIKTSKRSAYTWYQVYIPASAVKDIAGNKAKGYTWKFKTGKK